MYVQNSSFFMCRLRCTIIVFVYAFIGSCCPVVLRCWYLCCTIININEVMYMYLVCIDVNCENVKKVNSRKL